MTLKSLNCLFAVKCSFPQAHISAPTTTKVFFFFHKILPAGSVDDEALKAEDDHDVEQREGDDGRHPLLFAEAEGDVGQRGGEGLQAVLEVQLGRGFVLC